MPKITAVIIDTKKEPPNMKFGGIPVTYSSLEVGDLQAVTDEGHVIVVERKTTEDFLGSLGSKEPNHQLFIQLARMVQRRIEQQARGGPLTYWPYLVITSPFVTNAQGKIVTDRGVTGWDFRDVTGALLKIQEMGVFVTFADNPADYENCVLRIGKRERGQSMDLLPARISNVLGDKAVFIQSLARGIGIELTQKILDWSNNTPAYALSKLTDYSVGDVPVGKVYRDRIRKTLGLKENEILEIIPIGETHAQEISTTK